MKIAYGQLVSREFIAEVRAICQRFNWTDNHVNWLMACMAFESSGTFSPSIKNPISSGTGLIQFMSATAQHLGTTTDKLKQMTAVEQLAYVEKYFKPYAHRIHSLEDMYMSILWPAAIGLPLNHVLWSVGTKWYAANKGLDTKKCGLITKEIAASQVKARLNKGLKSNNCLVLNEENQPVKYLTLFQVLKQGYALTKASTWKSVATATALLTSMLTALLSLSVTSGWIPDGLISADTITAVSGATVSAVTLIIGYLGIATDEKQGVK